LKEDQLTILSNISKTKPESFFGIKPENYQLELNSFIKQYVQPEENTDHVKNIINQFN